MVYHQHGWPGRLFIVLCYFGAILAPLVGLTTDIPALPVSHWTIVGVSVALGVALFLLARGVARFNRLALWIALIVSALQILTSSAVLLLTSQGTPQTVRQVVSLALGVIYVFYFWRRIADL